MYELVNTSAENGLVAMSHGFTTVAMTQGMSENVRVRLEAFCAYRHRVNAHDESFFRENPVNWFYVEEAQVGRVMGRVAPCAFDYTGRTNRLARLCVLNEGEWPWGKSAADILEAKGEWFSEGWKGEPCYLPADKGKVEELAHLGEAQGAGRWREVFGARGDELARRVAWQIEKNVLTEARPIFFKTSVEWDVSGEKLLGLFAEVIGLVPEELRARVSFATYPDAMPSEVGCLLRGSFDAEKDAAFQLAESSQAWIDCVEGRVVHEELLPEVRMDWSMMLDEARRENAELKETLKNVQAANAVLDKECQRAKSAYQKLEAEHAELRKDYEKLKCTLLMATGKLRPSAEGANESGAAKISTSSPTLGNMQIERAPRAKEKVDTGLKLIMAAGLLIVSLIILGVVMVKYSEALSLRSHTSAEQTQGV